MPDWEMMTEGRVVIGRRAFLVASLVGVGGFGLTLAATASEAAAEALPADITPWITVRPDNGVVIRVTTPEIGNGVATQCALTIAEELRCDWRDVEIAFGSASDDYRSHMLYPSGPALLDFFGGRSTSEARTAMLLQLGASARARLVHAAAMRWNVATTDVEARNGRLIHAPSGRSLRFADVALDAGRTTFAKEPNPSPQAAWITLGKRSVPRLGLSAIVRGAAVYGIDVKAPGLLHAAIMQAPVHGGRLTSHDFDAVKDMPGVRGIAIVDPDEKRPDLPCPVPFGTQLSAAQSAVAIVADHYWQARAALEKMPITWADGPGGRWADSEAIYAAATAVVGADRHDGQTATAIEAGDVNQDFSGHRNVESTFVTPYCENAAMEPLNGTALVGTDGTVDLWHPTQHSQQAFLTAAHEAGVAPDKVRFHQTLVGGGFGRRVYCDDVRMVVAVARKFPGRPIKTIWSREETFRQGRYRPMIAARLRAALGPDGLPVSLDVRIAGRGQAAVGTDANGLWTTGLATSAYLNGIVPNVRVESRLLPLHILTGPYRGPGYNQNVFLIETFIDECAEAAGIEPLDYRRRLLADWPDEGWRRCLDVAAAEAGWDQPLPRGRGRGIAIGNWGGSLHTGPISRTGTTIAVVARVAVSKDGTIAVEALDVAFDCGRMLNEAGVIAQLEGGAMFGVNMALNEEITVEQGRVVEGNFDQYKMIRTAEVPRTVRIHTAALSGHDRFSEVGEPCVGPVAAAIGNAIYAATGKRLRRTPFSRQDTTWTA